MTIENRRRRLGLTFAIGALVPATAFGATEVSAPEPSVDASGAAVGSRASPPDASAKSGQGVDSSAHLHDGLYLRFAAGAGTVLGTPNRDDGPWSLLGAMMVGGTPGRGLVLGGALTTQYLQLRNNAYVMTIGPFLASYPAPRKGLNFQLMLGVAYTSRKFGDVSDVIDRTGVTLMGSVGYDTWIGDQWSLGPSFCLSLLSTKRTMEDAPAETIFMLVPTLALGVTYH